MHSLCTRRFFHLYLAGLVLLLLSVTLAEERVAGASAPDAQLDGDDDAAEAQPAWRYRDLFPYQIQFEQLSVAKASPTPRFMTSSRTAKALCG